VYALLSFYILIGELIVICSHWEWSLTSGRSWSFPLQILSLSNCSWVSVGWIIILTIVVLIVEVLSSSLANSNEVVSVDGVGDVGVEVILEVLEHVHIGLNIIVSSDSWEGEGGIVQLEGMYSGWLLSELLGDEKSIFVALDVATSRELVHLPFEFLVIDPKSWLACLVWWGQSINDTFISWVIKLIKSA